MDADDRRPTIVGRSVSRDQGTAESEAESAAESDGPRDVVVARAQGLSRS